MAKVTIADLLKMKDPIIPGTVAAQAMGMSSTRFIEYARQGRLPFHAMVSGTRVKVSRIEFLRFWGYTDKQIEEGQKDDTL